jgi:hypothetical protein
MSSLLRRGDAWLFPLAPPERLAMLRILTGLFAVIYLAVRVRAFLVLADAQPSRFEPVGVLSFLDTPLPGAFVVGLVFLALGLGLAYILGLWFRVCGPVFALVLLVLSTYRSSWGQILWIENLMVLHVLIVGFAPSADALTLRARRSSSTVAASRYGSPVRLAALVTVATYLLAAVAKLRLGGLDWMFSDALRNHVAYSAVRVDLLGGPASPIGRRLVGFAWLFPPMAVGAVVLELASPVVLIGGRVRTAWVASAWMMHLAIAALMYVTFPYPLFLVAFAPFYRLEGLADWARKRNLIRSRR